MDTKAEEMRERARPFLFDPVTYRLAYSSFAQTQGLTKLPYVPDPNNVLTPRELQTLQALQKYARGCIDWQMKWGCVTLVAPFHFCRDLGSPCQGAARNLGKGAKPHFLHARTNEVKQLKTLQNKAERIAWLQQRIDLAIQVCNRIRSQQLVDLQPGYYSHLRSWLDVFCKSQP